VYAIDVGYGQIHQRIREDNRVVVMERCNVRTLTELPEPIQLVVIDVSFISLKLVLPAARTVLTSDGICVPLIKPQFEAGKGQVGKGGVVREAKVHQAVIRAVIDDSRLLGLKTVALTQSPLTGPAGNIEFLADMRVRSATEIDPDSLLTSIGFGSATV
jgi:23S rRNA (cytidine1920-2'-O)/16S rRNA (cytidine1409-2'-O)-methyltransferase